MNTGDILMRSIIADPDDDAPRLVYADWLDENAGETKCGCWDGLVLRRHEIGADRCDKCNGTGRVSNGYAERAEFIRRQIELGVDNAFCGIDGKYSVAHLAFCEDVCNMLQCRLSPHKYIIFRRGFVDEIHLTCEQFMQHCHAIAAAHPVRKWVLTDKEPSYANNWYNYEIENPRGLLHPQSDLPLALFDLLENYEHDYVRCKRYSTKAFAYAAIQQACYTYARMPLLQVA